MGIDNYKLDISKLMLYLDEGYRMNFIVDFTALLRSKANIALICLSMIPKSKCCWYVISEFESQIVSLLETDDNSSDIFFYTDKMLDSLESCWDTYSDIPIHVAENITSTYDLFQKLSNYKKGNCLITGNETEAWRHILNEGHGNIILVTDEDVYYFPEQSFGYLKKENGSMLPVKKLRIANDFDKQCKTYKGKTIIFEDILCDTSAEGILYLSNYGEKVVKIFSDEVADQKLYKILELIKFKDKKENFAWPLEFVFSQSDDKKLPIGFIMPRMKSDFTLDELYTLEIDGQAISEHARWKVATSFLAQALFLYIHGIQIGDFNSNNFGVTEHCDIVLMDMDSYVVGRMGTQMKGHKAVPFHVDYTSRKDVIKVDYINVVSMIFEIITDGYWPFFYDEDTGLGEYRFTEDNSTNDEYRKTLKAIPNSLKSYFSKVLEKQEIGDPFELYFLLLKNEPEVPRQVASQPVPPVNEERVNKTYRSEDGGEEKPKQEVKKDTWFGRLMKGIRNMFS